VKLNKKMFLLEDQSFYMPFVPLTSLLDMLVWPGLLTTMSVSVCHNAEFYRTDWTYRANFFLRGSFLMCCKEIRVLPEIRVPQLGYFPLELYPKVWTWQTATAIWSLGSFLEQAKGKGLSGPNSPGKRPLKWRW